MLKITSTKAALEDINTELLAVTVSAKELAEAQKAKANRRGRALPTVSFRGMDLVFKGELCRVLKQRRFKAGSGECALIDLPGGKGVRALLVVGWDGKKGTLWDELASYRKLGVQLREHAEKVRAAVVHLAAAGLELGDEDCASALLEGTMLAGYRFLRYKTPDKERFKGIEELCIIGGKKISDRTLQTVTQLCEATAFARDLVNLPALECTPTFMVQKCREVARRCKLSLQVIDRERQKRMGANALLAVGQGSSEPSYLVKLVYKPRGRRAARVLSLVGKGITFDSGGLSIKTASGMETMKCDMSGAAAVLAAMQAISYLRPRVEVRAYIPLAENMISGRSIRPGDVIRAMNGKSIEILNTDAEGRLILADALSLAAREKSSVIVDVATLTGACVVALGPDYAGLFSNDGKLAEKICAAGELSGERYWNMPLAEEYRELLRSNIADLKNTGGPGGGAITAALFLKEFAGDSKWAHLDIAGPAFSDSDKGHIRRGGAGFAVRTLVRLALNS